MLYNILNDYAILFDIGRYDLIRFHPVRPTFCYKSITELICGKFKRSFE